MKKAVFALFAIAIGFAVPLVAAEIAFRFLPVSTGLMSQPVNDANPIFRFLADREYRWSRGWNFSIVNSGRVNASGFVNDQDYDTDATSPLLAVIGDSYVEATMVPFPDTLQGRLSAKLEGRGRVYSFAASGAPLSQYLAWAGYARDVFRPAAMVFVVIGNDFDESLLLYNQGQGLHHFSEDPDGTLRLVRVDYQPNPLREIVRRSALARYLVFNLEIMNRIPAIMVSLRDRWERITGGGPVQDRNDDARYLGNVARTADATRLDLSKRAVDAFFRELPEASGLQPQRIGFVLDGVRYPVNDDPEAYFVKMRRYFLEAARSRGYGAIDMDDLFLPEHAANGTRFEYPTDGHWNGIAHGLAADAVSQTALFEQVFGAE